MYKRIACEIDPIGCKDVSFRDGVLKAILSLAIRTPYPRVNEENGCVELHRYSSGNTVSSLLITPEDFDCISKGKPEADIKEIQVRKEAFIARESAIWSRLKLAFETVLPMRSYSIVFKPAGDVLKPT